MTRQEVENEVDRDVVDGHVIPKKVLFTRTMGNDSYKTMVFGDMLKVTAQLRTQPYPEPAAGSLCKSGRRKLPQNILRYIVLRVMH